MAQSSNKQIEMSRRGAAAMARQTAGRSCILTPNIRPIDVANTPDVPTSPQSHDDLMQAIWEAWDAS